MPVIHCTGSSLRTSGSTSIQPCINRNKKNIPGVRRPVDQVQDPPESSLRTARRTGIQENPPRVNIWSFWYGSPYATLCTVVDHDRRCTRSSSCNYAFAPHGSWCMPDAWLDPRVHRAVDHGHKTWRQINKYINPGSVKFVKLMYRIDIIK